MKLICLRNNLKENINIVEKISGKNLNLPILNSILLSIDKGKLKISSTNLEMGINTWTSGKIIKEGGICVPAKLFSNIINNIFSEKISLETKNNILYIQTDNYQATINGFNSKDFPIIPKINSKNKISLSGVELKKSLTQIVNSASFSETRPELSGIYFEFSKNILKLAATDSFRLSEKKININNNASQSFIVPLKTIQELIRILSEKGKDVEISFTENQILFDLEDVQIISRLIEGKFPDYNKIIPKNKETQIKINKDEFLNAVKLSGFFSSRLNDIKIKTDISKKEMIIFSQDQEIGENKVSISADIQGKDQEIIFNYKYLIDGINNFLEKEIIIELINEANPGILKSEKDKNYFYILMPIKG